MRKARNTAVIILAVVVTAGVAQNFAKLVWRGEVLEEPSSKAVMNTTPGRPLAAYALLTKTDRASLPIVVIEPMEFLYLVHYDPILMPRLFTVSWTKNDLFHRLYKNVREWCPVRYNRELTFNEFLPQNSRFFVFGNAGYAYELENLRNRGGEVKSLRFENGKFLAEVDMVRPE